MMWTKPFFLLYEMLDKRSFLLRGENEKFILLVSGVVKRALRLLIAYVFAFEYIESYAQMSSARRIIQKGESVPEFACFSSHL